MKLYSENESYKLYNGSMLDMLEVIEPNTIDSIVTDPPYELNFMGKGWDNSGIAFQKETWQKCYEVLKPGGYLLAFGGSRTFHRIACSIEDAGFEIRDTIMWLYGSGFPKSMDISKQIDKRADNNNKVIKAKEELGKWLKEKREYKKISKIELGKKLFNFNSNREDVPIQSWEIGKEIPTKEIYIKLKMILGLDDRYDYLIEGRPSNYIEAEREVIGTKKSGGASAWINGMNNKENEEQKYTGISEWEITAPSTDLAKQWQGWGTALKPSFEPIIVARKPFKGSLVDNVIEYGVGGINIDECRVETTETNRKGGATTNGNLGWKPSTKTYNDGRFPANTILTYDETDFDEVCGGFPNTKSVKSARGGARKNLYEGFKTKKEDINYDCGFNDSGSASRYFYCAKASKKDRDEGLDEFKEIILDIGNERPSGGSWEKRTGKKPLPRKNIHPTVKPTELMQYLVRLVSPNGATILDPFNGSGSTGKAVMYENKERNKNYKYIGIELTEEYLPITKARIEYVCNLIEEEKTKDKQLTIFDMGD